MFIPQSFLEELKNRIKISDIIKPYVALRHKGRDEYSGLCPFHKEKTSSFTVSDNKGFYHCFGCGAHGSVFDFLKNYKNLPFPEVVEELANKVGMQLPKISEDVVKQEKKRLSLFEIVEQACVFFQEQLNSGKNHEAVAYIKKRGLSDSVVNKFRLGFAPNARNMLTNYLKVRGVTDNQLVETGLSIRSDRGELYDRFRGRVMFPICDIKGRVVAFGGRILGDGQPKYLNSPETILFKKGSMLFNEHNARHVALKTQRLVVVEGYMDVIALDAAGIKCAVAPLGTALTELQIERLWRMTKDPVICLDGDSAGQRAMSRVADIALNILKPGYTLKFAILPQKMDPDDLIKSRGVQEMRRILQQSSYLSDVIWQIELGRQMVETPEQKADLSQRLDKLTLKIKDESLRKYYKNDFNKKMWELFNYFSRKKSAKENDSMSAYEMKKNISVDINTIEGSETLIMLSILNNPQLLGDPEVKEEFISVDFVSNKLDKIRMAVLEIAGSEVNFSKDDLLRILNESDLSDDILAIYALRLGGFSEPCSDFSEAMKVWKYAFGLSYLARLKKEYKDASSQMTEESEQIANALSKQVQEMEFEISSFYQSFSQN
ncbi:DNA primase [Rickettsiales bacterium]|nr:DNA primase [Rickettsiales bacterium]